MDRNNSEEKVPTAEIVTRAIRRGAREAMRLHKLHGVPVHYSKDGKIMVMQPHEIPDYPDED